MPRLARLRLLHPSHAAFPTSRLILALDEATITDRRLCFGGGKLKEIVERILAPLVGLKLWGLSREADVLIAQFGERSESSAGVVGAYTLRIACAWRIAGPTSILVASGDLFTPSDAEAELETFDWDVPGASWWDVRMHEVANMLDAGVVVATFLADTYGGVRLVATGGFELEIFPNSSQSPDVETEFWRLLRSNQVDDYVSVGTSGIELVQPT